MLSWGGPWAVHVCVTREVSQACEMALSADPAKAAQGVATLKRFCWPVNFDCLLRAYEKERDAQRRQRIAAVYHEVTGSDIEAQD